MQIDGYVQALREDLARVAAVGDESTARAAELLAVALESAIGRRLLEALGEAALELNGQLDRRAHRGPVRRRRPGARLRPRRGGTGRRARRRGVHGPDHPPPAREPEGTARGPRHAGRGLRQHVDRPRAHARGRAAFIHRRRLVEPPPPHRLRPDVKGAGMFFHEPSPNPRSTHWVYDDPVGSPRGAAHRQPLRTAPRLGRAGGRERRPLALRVARAHREVEPPPHDDPRDLRCRSIASTRRSRPSSRSRSRSARSRSRRSTATSRRSRSRAARRSSS